MVGVLLSMFLVPTNLNTPPPLVGDPTLVEVLRDAQVANRETLQTGTLTGRIELQYPELKGPNRVTLETRAAWDGEDAFWMYRLTDPVGLYRPGVVPGPPALRGDAGGSHRDGWEYRLLLKGKLYSYDAERKILHVHDPKTIAEAIFSLPLPSQWFRCCPPAEGGRPWVEMIGPHAAFPSHSVSSYEVRREGQDLIRQVRRDRNGGVLETVFSFAACGNVIESRYEPPRGSEAKRSSVTYRWRHREGDGVCVLQECEARESVRGRPDEPQVICRIVLERVDLDAATAASRLNLRSFMPRCREMPPW